LTHHWGYASAVSSALLFGIGTTLNKIVLAETHPTVVAGLVYLFAGISLSLVRLSPLQKRIVSFTETCKVTETKKIGGQDIAILALVVLSGSIIAPYLFLNGLNQTTAINASLLQNTESLFTMLIAFLFLRERASRKDWIGVLFLVAGVAFLTTNSEFYRLTLTESLLGNVLIVTACLFWGIDNNLSKFLSEKQDLTLITALKCFTGGTILLLLGWALGLSFRVPLSALPFLVTVGAFSIGFSIFFFLLALRGIGAMKTGVIFSTSSLFGAVFAFLTLRESFSVTQLIAGATMLVGIYIIYRKQKI
jgi:drug/metabolite transporter (DMT)-like permease